MKIKGMLLAGLIMVSLTITSFSQVGIGVKGSALFSTVKVNGIESSFVEKSNSDGFDIAIYGTIPVTPNFSFQPEISYNQKGFEVGQGVDLNLFNVDIPLGVAAETKIDYLQVPLLGRYEVGNEKAGAYFFGGPSLAFALKGSLRTKINSIIDINLTKTDLNLSNEDYNRFEFAGVIGTGAFVNIGGAKLFGEIKYHHGFSDLLVDPILDIELKNRAFGIGAGIQLTL